jgi:hypothetical protein
LTEWKVPDGLPEVTFVVIAHTDKKGQALFGSVTQFADCDVLYQLERVERTDQATLTCIGTRDIEEPPAITFEMQKVGIITAKGNEQNLVVSKEVPILDQILDQPMQSKQDANKAAKESSLDDLAFRTLAGFWHGPQSWTQWSEWFEITKAARGKTGLGPGTFTDIVNRLVDAGRVRKSAPDGLYQVVFEADVEADAVSVAPASASTSSSTSTSDFSNLGFEKSQKSEVTSGSARSARSNSTESGDDENTVVPKAPPDDALDQRLENDQLLKDAVDQLLKKSNGKPSAR